MAYLLTGTFTEACDCRLMCPCWTDDEPDEGHCTGLFAWQLAPSSTVNRVDVGGARVVSLSAHVGRRRPGRPQDSTVSVLYIETRGLEGSAFEQLRRAFSGELNGPLRGLSAVSGTVVLATPAQVTITETGQTRTVSVVETSGGGAVSVDLRPAGFDGNPPLQLHNTALHRELGASGSPVIAQHSGVLDVRVAALPRGNIQVTGRSGMTGSFRYQQP